MSIYKLVTIDQRFIAETIARTGSEQLLDKVARSFVGLYNQEENWYIPLRANLGKKKPEGSYFETPFPTNNSHFKRPGLDFQKAIFVPLEYTIEIRNTLPKEQSELIFSKQDEIRESFETYVLSVDSLNKQTTAYKFSTVPLFPEGIKQIKKLRFQKNKEPEQEKLFDNMIDVLPEFQNNSRLSQAKRKLDRLEREYQKKVEQLYEHQKLTNGQPMNDKRNGHSWIKQHERIENSVRDLLKEIEDQKDRVEKLEWQNEAKELGINNQGGLIMSVDNIPQIKEEIEKAKRGESMYSSATIQKYKKQLKELESVKERSESAKKHLSDHAKALIDSDEIKQWSKKPTIYFVNGLRKVALELTAEGTFVESKNYPATTEEEKKKIAELLSSEAVLTKKIPSEKEDRSIQDIIKQKDYKALSSHLKDGVASYLETDTFKKYLNFVSKFHKYSHRNVRLLLAQNPETTRVSGYKKWQEVGRTVNKGEKALYVYAPGSKIVKDKNGEPVKDENGQVVKEKFYFLTPVFDVSQTSGEPIPKPIYDLEGKFETPEQFFKVFKAVEAISPVPIKIEPIEGTARGYYHKKNKEIIVKTGLGEVMTLKTLIHEITHAKLHSESTCIFGDEKYSQQEFEAESVAYIVSNHLGIDTSKYSFGYLASWTEQGKTIESFTESLDRITKEAQQIIESLDHSLSLSFAMEEPANKFEERLAKAQGKDIQSTKSGTKVAKENESAKKETQTTSPKEERPQLKP